jgi:hypothetical protein
MLDILEAPFPFLVGVRADTFWQRYAVHTIIYPLPVVALLP